MKKYVIMGLLLFTPFVGKASLMGFQDGNMYDQATGTWQCLFLMDGNCYDLNQNVLFTRPPGYVAPVIVPDITPTQTVYVPVYSTPTNQPLATGGVPAPVSQPTTPTTNSTTQGVSMLPAYSESELLNKIGVKASIGVGQQALKLPGACYSINSTSMGCDWSGPYSAGISVVFNNVSYNTPSGAVPVVTDLTPSTTYSYQFVFHEDGREDTVLTKSFTTPAQ